ncbi:50S ribosomal protein L22 [archaeon]|jgi:large subunit ribosomal protein L22|nr:50S ribosomal protein L22 [archaeon]MDP6548264.1 50S ribosomal protein L22 [Candidatus Woesearchaeota archaeon]|tara:strand:+ start:12658 stop:13209 length:552 start_codon:yes stop_codon:yes gene_type:complete
MGHKYSLKDYNKENMARAIGVSLPISSKQSIEICNFIREKDVNFAKKFLDEVIKDKKAVPFKRFNADVGHKKGMAAGRYPKKASMEFLSLLNQVEANAQFKGLNTANLIIAHINSNKAAKTARYGRQRSRNAKRTNVEIVVLEKAESKPDAKKKAVKKETAAKKTKESANEKSKGSNPGNDKK